MSHPLDRVAWNTLTGPHIGFSLGNDRARRFTPDIGPIAASVDSSPEALADLAELVPADGYIIVIELAEMPVPSGLVLEKSAPILQLVAEKLTPGPEPVGYLELGDADAPEMLALAQLTEPGPFSTATHRLGQFVGIRENDRLIAMAGERMKLPGYTEVSGVCTHPDARGRGFAEMLSRLVTQRIFDRGETPFLHAWETNQGAIALYQKLGFSIRQRLIATAFRQA